jgi:hypothetical protein
MLAENFMRIALYDEYRRGTAASSAEETESRLRRWEVPVRVGMRFGASVPPDRQATDRARIAVLSGPAGAGSPGIRSHWSTRNPNFFVHIVSEDEREALGPVINATDARPVAGRRGRHHRRCRARPIAWSMPWPRAIPAATRGPSR